MLHLTPDPPPALIRVGKALSAGQNEAPVYADYLGSLTVSRNQAGSIQPNRWEYHAVAADHWCRRLHYHRGEPCLRGKQALLASGQDRRHALHVLRRQIRGGGMIPTGRNHPV